MNEQRDLERAIDRLYPAEAGEGAWDDVVERAGFARRSRRIGGRALALAAAVVALCAAAAGAAVWQHETAVPQPSVTPHPGWVLHTRVLVRKVPYAGAGRWITFLQEHWTRETRDCESRKIQQPDKFGLKEVESAIATEPSGRIVEQIFDPEANTIFTRQILDCSAGLDQPDQATTFRDDVRRGVMRITGRLHLDGHDVYRLEWKEENPIQTIMYVDRKTFVPVRWENLGYPLTMGGGPRYPTCLWWYDKGHPKTTATYKVTDWEYLPPTRENLEKLSLTAQHPSATIAPAKDMSERFRKILYPPSCQRTPSAP